MDLFDWISHLLSGPRGPRYEPAGPGEVQADTSVQGRINHFKNQPAQGVPAQIGPLIAAMRAREGQELNPTLRDAEHYLVGQDLGRIVGPVSMLEPAAYNAFKYAGQKLLPRFVAEGLDRGGIFPPLVSPTTTPASLSSVYWGTKGAAEGTRDWFDQLMSALPGKEFPLPKE